MSAQPLENVQDSTAFHHLHCWIPPLPTKLPALPVPLWPHHFCPVPLKIYSLITARVLLCHSWGLIIPLSSFPSGNGPHDHSSKCYLLQFFLSPQLFQPRSCWEQWPLLEPWHMFVLSCPHGTLFYFLHIFPQIWKLFFNEHNIRIYWLLGVTDDEGSRQRLT
jgi:hypothetical protein